MGYPKRCLNPPSHTQSNHCLECLPPKIDTLTPLLSCNGLDFTFPRLIADHRVRHRAELQICGGQRPKSSPPTPWPNHLTIFTPSELWQWPAVGSCGVLLPSATLPHTLQWLAPNLTLAPNPALCPHVCQPPYCHFPAVLA